MNTISVKKVKHKDRQRIALIFEYDPELIKKVKRIPGIKWSQTMGCWHAPASTDLTKYLDAHDSENRVYRSSEIRPKGKIEPIDKVNRLAIRRYNEWMLQHRYSINTVNLYVSKMKSFFASENKSWFDLTTEDIVKYNYDEFVRHEKKRRHSSQNIFLSALKLFYRANRSDNLVPEDIERPRGAKRLPQVLSQDEVKRIFEVTRNLKHRALLMLVYSAGLRIGETLNLRIEDVNSKRGVIEIHSGKGDKDRQVPLSQKILDILRDYFKVYRPTEFLFEGRSETGRYSPRSAQQVLQHSVERAGIKKRVTLHTLRHSYATHLMEKGVGLRYIQDILGHRSPKTTMIYTHVSGKKLKDVISPLDDMDL